VRCRTERCRFGFFGADNEHVRNFLQLRVADFAGASRCGRRVDAKIVALQSSVTLLA